jgi:hypothetical protein
MSAKIDYATNTVTIPHDEFVTLVRNLDPKKKAMHKYVDALSGKVLWNEGEPVARAKTKVPTVKPTPKVKKNVPAYNAYDEFDSAVQEFARNTREDFSPSDLEHPEDSEYDPSDISPYASDLADSFFWTYPWEKWAKELKMSKADMKSYVAEMIVG